MNPVVCGAPSGAKLTYLPFVIKALSISLGKFPGLNTCLEPGGGALLQHHSHNIGVAMATSNGLVVPNIKQVRAQHCAAVSVQYSTGVGRQGHNLASKPRIISPDA